MQRALFFDLDGTLIDPHQRLYRLFMDLVPQARFTYEEYWQIKRQRTNQKTLLTKWFDYSPDALSVFQKAWMAQVEEESRLAEDTPFAGTTTFLKDLWSQGYKLYVVTARQNPDLAAKQITHFGWDGFLADLLVTQQAATKSTLIKERITDYTDAIFIGDTGEDVLTAKELNMVAVAVCSGFLARNILEEYKPDYIIDSILDLHETGLLYP